MKMLKVSPKFDRLKLILIGIVGVILVIMGNFMSRPETSGTVADSSLLLELREYQELLAAELEKIVSSVKGVGDVSVSVTLEAGPQIVYVTNTTTSRNSQTEPVSQGQSKLTVQESETSQVVTGRGSGTGDLLMQEKVLAPKISGCVVVAQGAQDSLVKMNIYRAVQVLLDIPIYKIEVLPMKGGEGK